MSGGGIAFASTLAKSMDEKKLCPLTCQNQAARGSGAVDGGGGGGGAWLRPTPPFARWEGGRERAAGWVLVAGGQTEGERVEEVNVIGFGSLG